MSSLSPFQRRAPAVLLLGLLLGACSSHPCPSDRELMIVAAGQLDYVFEDGAAASADLGEPDSRAAAGISSGHLDLSWRAPASSNGGDMPDLHLSLDVPEADGSFELGDVAARVCACEKGSVSGDLTETKCMLDWKTPLGPADCRAPAGQLEIHHIIVGNCESRAGCVRTIVMQVALSEDAEKGLLGTVSFVENSEKLQGSCVNVPILHGL